MRITLRDITLVVLALLLIAALIAFTLTRETARSEQKQIAKQAVQEPPKLVDQEPLVTAYDVVNLASTAAEQKLASEAVRIADHEVDMAFMSAVQQTQLHPPVENSTTKDLNARIQMLESRLQSVQDQADSLTKLAAGPHKDDDAVQQQLELAQARAALLQDGLDDAKEDLLRAGGDPQAQIKQELADHEALQHGKDAASATASSKPESFGVAGNLLSQFRTWQRLRSGQARLLDAKKQAETYAATLLRKHQTLEKGLTEALGSDDSTSQPGSDTAAPTGQTQPTAKISKLHGLSQNGKALAQYDKRIQSEQQLAAVYGQWADIVAGQIRVALHAMLRSLLMILLALFFLVLAEGLIERFYMSLGPDRRRLGTMRLVLRFVSQFIGVVVILLVVFGLPSQLSTVLALGAAGLTVALRDFIVAFFGWFVLMGRHGIRAGDWVEINGIGGEVIEVGLLRTILLETGNWNDAGHPTGRKVSFVNSFAVEGHYFNFTTSGQWLWDELDVLIPAGEDPYRLTNSVLQVVTEQTKADAASAEQEWQRATQRSAIQTFSATPAINVRPSNLGVNLVVRYVVNAHNRYEVRTRLYQAIVELLHSEQSARIADKQLPVTP
jgi:small-conductance mechanosensitive channel